MSPIDSGFDIKSILPLLNKGELGFIEDSKQRPKQVSLFTVIEATLDEVWDVLTDYEHYTEIFPSVLECKIAKREGDTVFVDYKLDAVLYSIKYRLKHDHYPKKRIDISVVSGDLKSGEYRYDIHPFENKTILIYSIKASATNTSFLLRRIVKKQPTMDEAINISTAIITLNNIKEAIKRRQKER
ncbi:MAG: SRPBCC family protein [Deltaproteobacteria bacterium]|nr:SRPBCC family protein [Deltaproteobacteria bacterium]